MDNTFAGRSLARRASSLTRLVASLDFVSNHARLLRRVATKRVIH